MLSITSRTCLPFPLRRGRPASVPAELLSLYADPAPSAVRAGPAGGAIRCSRLRLPHSGCGTTLRAAARRRADQPGIRRPQRPAPAANPKVSSHELLLDDAIWLARRAAVGDVAVALESPGQSRLSTPRPDTHEAKPPQAAFPAPCRLLSDLGFARDELTLTERACDAERYIIGSSAQATHSLKRLLY